MCHRSCSLAEGFYTKLYTKSAVSESSIALARLNLTFQRLGLFHDIWHTCSTCSWLQNDASDFLMFAQGLSYGLSKLKKKKRVKLSLNFERSQLRPGAKNKKSEARFCRPAHLLSFCENRFRLLRFVKNLNLTKRGAFFRHFASPR